MWTLAWTIIREMGLDYPIVAAAMSVRECRADPALLLVG
jgi:IMP dehydrogenase/GMP reductase